MISRKGIGGPKTEEGKKRVSLNAMKHGLTAVSPQGLETLAQDIGVTYEQVLEDFCRHYRPKDAVEEVLVKRIARCAWRLIITQAVEDRYLERRGLPNSIGKTYERIIKHERLSDIQLHRAIAALARKREREQNQNSQNKLNPDPVPSSNRPLPKREFVLPEPVDQGERREPAFQCQVLPLPLGGRGPG
ncbi:MAG: hypothetical protein ABFD83_04420 [Armatimonadota bacterium]